MNNRSKTIQTINQILPELSDRQLRIVLQSAHEFAGLQKQHITVEKQKQ